MAHKKAAGSAKNLRDSKPKYRGVKLFGWQKVARGNIIIRQKGNKYECGENVYMGRDFTLHASMDGFVFFSKKKKTMFNGRKYLKTYVHVTAENKYLVDEASVKTEKATEEKKAPAKKTTTKKTPAKKAATKTITKKTATKKAPAKKTTTKKAPAKKVATKTTTKKTATKKAE